MSDQISYYTYIVRCSDGTFYTGQTNNLERRLNQHNTTKQGAWYTKFKRPVELAYYEIYSSRKLACQREASIKKLSRKQKEELCKQNITI